MTTNNVTLVGRLVKEPQLTTTKNDKVVANFAIGVPRPYKLKGERFAPQDMIACRCWGEPAERICRYCSKGDWLAISGSIWVDQYEKDGQKRSFMYVLCSNIDYVRAKDADWATGMHAKHTKNKLQETGNTFDEMGQDVDVGDFNW